MTEKTILEQLIAELTELGVASLSGFFNDGRLDRLDELGIAINSNTLSEILVSEKGLNVFKDKELRKQVLIKYSVGELKEHFNLPDGFSNVDLDQINSFNWGGNVSSLKFLELIGLNPLALNDNEEEEVFDQNVKVEETLYPYQNWLRKEVIRFLESPDKKRAIVHMPTGTGKTRTSLESVCDFIRARYRSSITVVWFAHSEELCEQAVETMGKLWSRYGSEDAQIIRLWGGKSIDNFSIDKPTFVVTSFQTAYNMLSTRDDARFELFSLIKRNCALVIVDEAHQSTAPTYREAIELFQNNKTKLLGLTATPGRHHVGADVISTQELSKFFNNCKIDIVGDDGKKLKDPISYFTDKGILSEPKRFKISSGSDIKLTPGELRHIEKLMDIPQSVLKKLGADAVRTNLIATNTLKLVIDDKRQTIVFAPSKENAVELAALLRLKGCKAGAIIGDTGSQERAELIRSFKNGELSVLTNFGVLTTGFDAPKIGAVIIARPTLSVVLYSQMIGRGLRGPAMGGTADCCIVDVVDNITNMPDANNAFTYFDEYFNN